MLKMTKHFSILLFIVIGFMFIPSMSSDCDKSSSEMTCCKGKSKLSESCCKDHLDSNQIENHNCKKNCNHSSCNCSSVQSNFALLCIENDKKSTISEIEVQNYHSIETYILSGFHSIWLPPKIG